jgi:hypothetical protein
MGKRLSEKNPFLRDAEKKKRLMVSAISSSQRQEGIDISEARAEEVYKIVFEEPPVAFFRLIQAGPAREEVFVHALAGDASGVRFDLARREFLAVDGAPLSYWLPSEVMDLFRALPRLEPSLAEARQGLATSDDPRFVRQRWEVIEREVGREMKWVPFAKGGEFSRFYSAPSLVVLYADDGRALKQHALTTPGTTHWSRRIYNAEYYFRPGLTWPRAGKVLSIRAMPEGCIFADKGPGIFLKDAKDEDYLLGVLNSSMVLYLCKARTSREEMGGRWEVGVIQKLPIPRPSSDRKSRIASLARSIHDAKAGWDAGNEISTHFNDTWLASALRQRAEGTFGQALDEVLAREAAADSEIQASYSQLDAAVFDAYGLSQETRETVLKDLGDRPPELIWPQMEGKSAEQKRMEHVWRLLSFCAKRVIDGDDDGIVPLVKCSNEPPLEERVLAELGTIVGADRLHEFEGEVASELRKRVPGYKRADSVGDWLTNVYFEHHVRLYKSRPIYWHLASGQQADPAFGVVVHYHRFGKDALRKLRGSYVRGCLDRLEREFGQARNDNRADDAVDLQQRIEEVRAFDRKLQALDEGEFPIRVPWKEAARQPKGWSPDIDDGVKVNIVPLQAAGLLRIARVVSAASEEDE